MTFIDPANAVALKEKMSADPSGLGKLFKAKSSRYMTRNVDHSLVEDLLNEGWEEYGQPLKTKTRLRKIKSHDQQFEDDIWCQLYRLGYRNLNVSRDFILPFGQDAHEKKQIDVVAVDEDTILLVECKSSEIPKKAPSFKTEFEALRQRLHGHSKALEQIFGKGRKIKYIFATRNLRLSRDSADVRRLEGAKGFFYNDNTFDYVESLLKSYKNAARYQILGLLFKGQQISKERIEVPAIEGKMGTETYYMFSLEPSLLLKMGFVLHRTRANEAEMPTYQRLLVPSRLKGITKFIDQGGYFPNSAIVNFNESDAKLEFQGQQRAKDSKSRTGVLKIPNTYAIAYIIDGQHRIYGYANSKFLESNTIPVVAFVGLAPSEQLEMFMDINQNQKAVSPTLRITLEEDLYWNSTRLDSRLKALRSSIIRKLGGDQSGPLYGEISLGEDKAKLQAKPFADALLKSGLLPEAKGNRYVDGTTSCGLYDTTNTDHEREMMDAQSRVVDFINQCYEMAESYPIDQRKVIEDYIVTNRGTYAFISLIGSLNAHESEQGKLAPKTPSEERFREIEKYLRVFFDALKAITPEQSEILTGKLGSGAEVTWLRVFQSFINARFNSYNPPELQDWKERQDRELQDTGRELGTQIERHLKASVLRQLKQLFGDNWDLEIGAIKRKCADRAEQQMEKNYKEGLGRAEIPWTDQFEISDYKSIIEKYWSKSSDDKSDFETFEKQFSIDIGHGFNSKSERLRWMSIFGSLRNNWAHEGTKEKGLNRSEVDLIRKVHKHFKLDA